MMTTTQSIVALPRSILIAFLALLAAPLVSQCTTAWQTPQLGFGVFGTVNALTPWDADGAGPAVPQLLVAGTMTIAGDVLVNNCALYDPTTDAWTAMGNGTDGAIHAAITLANGDVLVAGQFTTAGGIATCGVARWDGTWHAVGNGISLAPDAVVLALAEAQNGDLFAGGEFLTMDGVGAQNVARWNGTSWQPLSTGIASTTTFAARVLSLAAPSSGELLCGGLFDTAGGLPARRLASWDGSNWSEVPGLPHLASQVLDVLERANGDLAVALGWYNGTAYWSRVNGSWVPLGTLAGHPDTLFETSAGELVSAMSDAFGNPGIIRWDGSAWQQLGLLGFLQEVHVVANLPGAAATDLVVGGDFASLNAMPVRSLSKFENGIWSTAPATPGRGVSRLATGTDGSTYVAGGFVTLGGVPARRVARWTDQGWGWLGGGVNGNVKAITVMANGDLVATGDFTLAGTTPVSKMARWDGQSWTAIPGVSTPANRLLGLRDGRLAATRAALSRGVRIWDGNAWHSIFGVPSSPQALAELPDGRLVIGLETYTFAVGGRVAAWDGQALQSLDPAGVITTICDLAVLPNGEVIAAGLFTNGDYIGRWDGLAWQPMADGLNDWVEHLQVLPNGDVMAAGEFTHSGPTYCPRVARWNGLSWQQEPGAPSEEVVALAVHPAGTLLALSDESKVFSDLTRLQTDCPANAIVIASGCPNGAIANQLKAERWPMLDGDYVAYGTGMASQGILANVLGLQPASIALAGLVPGALPGCTLAISPEVVDAQLLSAQPNEYRLRVPSSAALVGSTFRHQMVPFELDSLGTIVSTTASNALELTIGSF